MVYGRITHVAIQVPDLIAAEDFYTTLFDTEVEFRETTVDGEWHTLAKELNWKDATEAGYQPKMSFVVKDEFFLALDLMDDQRSGESSQKHHIGLEMAQEELKALIGRAKETSCSILRKSEKSALVEDIFGNEWDIATDWQPRSTGDRTGNLIKI